MSLSPAITPRKSVECVQDAVVHEGRAAIADFFEGMDVTDVTLDLNDGAVDAHSVGNGEEVCHTSVCVCFGRVDTAFGMHLKSCLYCHTSLAIPIECHARRSMCSVLVLSVASPAAGC